MPDNAIDYDVVINGKLLTLIHKAHISTMVYEESLEETAKLELGISDYEGFDLDPNSYKLGSLVEFSLGIFPESLPMFGGEITQIPPLFPAGDIPDLGLICYDKSYKLKRVPPPKIYTETNLDKIVTQIAKAHGLKSVTSPAGPLVDFKFSDDQSIGQVDETDWEILTQIAKIGNYKIFVRFDTLYMVDDNYLLSQQKKEFNFIYNPAVDDLSDTNNLQILEFSPELGSKDQRIQVDIISWASVSASGEKKGNAKLSKAVTDGSDYTEVKVDSGSIEVLRILGTAAKTEAQAKFLARSELQKRADNLVKGDLSILGNPYVRIGQRHNVTVNGLGKFGEQYTGRYIITKVVHTVDDSGFITDLSVRRSGLTPV